MALNLSAQTEAPGAEAGPGGTQAVPPKAEPPPPLEEIARHFPQLEVLECLGRGGMGVVYKARQPRLDRFVALKILAREKEKDPRFAERFTREAQALARLNHPNIVTVYDFGEADGLYYLLMEYVDGMNLRQLLQNRSMAPEEALAIVPAICDALQYAHQQGIVHRDVKPENILLDKQGRVKIADFGIAKLLSAAGQMESLTGEQQVVGTPHYMAPEQVETPGVVDHRADIYSLGVVFYEMLTGELPMGKFAPPSRMVKVDVRLDEVVLHALEKEPERRYQQAGQVKSDVETIATTPGGGRALPPAAAPREVNPWQPAILLVAALISAALLLAGTMLPRPINWIAFLFGSFGLVIAALKLGGVWPFPSGLFPKSNFTRRNLGSTTPTVPPSLSLSEDLARQVSGPAIGLIIVAILNWVAIPLTVLVTTLLVSGRGSLAPGLLLVPLSALVLSSVMLIAGLKMKRLQAYGLAITGAVLAILVTPGNLVGLPVGIWALVVLCQRQVREAFGEGYATLSPVSGQPSHGGGGWKIAAVIAAAVMLLLAIPVGAILLAIGVPNYQRARAHAKMLQEQSGHPAPTFVIRGTVTDVVTGRPISGARVDDNAYGARSTRSPQQAWTDAQGHYELRTWNEEHTVTASAPGYQTKLETFIPGQTQTNASGMVEADEARRELLEQMAGRASRLNFQLEPAGSTRPEASPEAPAAPTAPPEP